MQKDQSLIDILKSIPAIQQVPTHSTDHQREKPYKSQQLILTFPRCQSAQFLTLHPHFLKPKSEQIAQQQNQVLNYTSPKKNSTKQRNKQYKFSFNSKTAKASHQSSSQSRADQILFQIKIKLATFIIKFNIDSKFLTNIRQQPIQNVLQLVFKKFKQYTKEHDTLLKSHNQLIKCKDIQIYNLQTKLCNLEELHFQQTNRWYKSKDKIKQQHHRLQQSLQQLQIQNQQLRQNVYMLQTIIKQQNQYINTCKYQINQQFQAQTSRLKYQLAQVQKKYQILANQSKDNYTKLSQENQNLNQEIQVMMEQAKSYKNQKNALKQQLEQLRIELENNEEKLLDFYDRLQKQMTTVNQLNDRINQLRQQNRQIQQKAENSERQKRMLQEGKQMILDQFLDLKKKNQLKQAEIIKLNKTLSEIMQAYRNRGLRKTKSIEPDESYTIIINAQKTNKRQIKQDENDALTKQLQKLRLEHEEELARQQERTKKIIEQWREQMQKTVLFYEGYVEEIEGNLLQKQNKILELSNKLKKMQINYEDFL